MFERPPHPPSQPAVFCPYHPEARLAYRPDDKPVLKNETIESGRGHYVSAATVYCPVCRMNEAGCPKNLWNTTFNTFDTSTPERARVLAAAKEFAELIYRRQCGFGLLVGPPGSGKTRLASNIVAATTGDSLYRRQGELTLKLRATYARKEIIMRRGCSDDDDDDEQYISPPQPLVKARRASFLVLDEIGCNPLANDERLLIDELIKHRYDNGKPTILISNLPLDKFKEFLGDALIDRIKHASGNGRFIIQFAGESYRRSDGEGYFGKPT